MKKKKKKMYLFERDGKVCILSAHLMVFEGVMSFIKRWESITEQVENTTIDLDIAKVRLVNGQESRLRCDNLRSEKKSQLLEKRRIYEQKQREVVDLERRLRLAKAALDEIADDVMFLEQERDDLKDRFRDADGVVCESFSSVQKLTQRLASLEKELRSLQTTNKRKFSESDLMLCFEEGRKRQQQPQQTSKQTKSNNNNNNSGDDREDPLLCGICFTNLKSYAHCSSTDRGDPGCGYMVCESCMKNPTVKTCPMCRGRIGPKSWFKCNI